MLLARCQGLCGHTIACSDLISNESVVHQGSRWSDRWLPRNELVALFRLRLSVAQASRDFLLQFWETSSSSSRPREVRFCNAPALPMPALPRTATGML